MLTSPEIKERIERLIRPEDLGAIIRESSSHKELVHFAAREGLSYPGCRMESIPHLDLAMDIVEDAFAKPDLFKQLTSWLTEKNLPFIQKIEELPERALIEVHQLAGELLDTNRLGPFLWALLCDSRKQAETAIPKLLGSARKVLLKEEKIVSRAAGFWQRMKEGVFARGDKEKAAELAIYLSEKLKKTEKENEKLLKDSSRLAESNRALTEQLSSLRLSFDEARRGRELAERKLRSAEENVKRLADELETLKRTPPSFQEKITVLETDLHHQRKECRRHLHELERVLEKFAFYEAEQKRFETELAARAAELEHLRCERGALKEKLETVSVRESAQTASQQSNEPRKEKSLMRSVTEKRSGRIGIFLDARSLFRQTRARGIRLDYDQIFQVAVNGRNLVKAIAFFAVEGNASHHEKLARVLERAGFEIRTVTLLPHMKKPGGWELFLGYEVLGLAERSSLETVVLIGWEAGGREAVGKLKEKKFRVENFSFEDAAQPGSDLSVNLADSSFHLSEAVLPQHAGRQRP